MPLLYRYILRNFLQNFLFGLLSFIIIFILVDLFENLDKFVDRNVPQNIIFEYYLFFIPEIIKLLIPVATLLASLFTISKFNSSSELIAMFSGGLSYFKVLIPLISTGIIITMLSIYFNGWVVPLSNKEKLKIERTYLGKNQINTSVQNLFLQDQYNRIISIGVYDEVLNKATNANISLYKTDSIYSLTERIDISELLWDTLNQSWTAINSIYRTFQNDSVTSMKIIDTVLTDRLGEIGKINLTPGIILKNQLKPDEMSISEYQDFISNLKLSGLQSSRAEVDYYSKFSFPFAAIITILFGASIAINNRKSGAALQFGFSIFISFIYLGFVKISQVFGYNGEINPLLTAWLANLIFLFIAIINFLRIK